MALVVYVDNNAILLWWNWKSKVETVSYLILNYPHIAFAFCDAFSCYFLHAVSLVSAVYNSLDSCMYHKTHLTQFTTSSLDQVVRWHVLGMAFFIVQILMLSRFLAGFSVRIWGCICGSSREGSVRSPGFMLMAAVTGYTRVLSFGTSNRALSFLINNRLSIQTTCMKTFDG